jgi:LacI family transcriptional regulator
VTHTTQKQVAERARVSRTTVSYVLNDKSSPGVPISDETRRKVLEAVEALSYQPNVAARSLRSGRTYTIGVLMLDLHNPHFWQYLSGIEAEAHREGYAIMVFHTALKRSEENVALRELTKKSIDGAIVNASYGIDESDKTDELATSGIPIVNLSTGGRSPFDHVDCDYRSATRELMSHLFTLGHRRFGFVYGVVNPENGLDRLEPFRQSLAEEGLPPENGQVVQCGPAQEDAYKATVQLLDQRVRPTAIIAINDFLAMSVLRAAADLGVRVPADVSVCGFDDIPFSQYLIPRLTTVRRETEEGGARAFRLLLDRMNGKTGPIRFESIPASLQIRESTGPVTLE